MKDYGYMADQSPSKSRELRELLQKFSKHLQTDIEGGDEVFDIGVAIDFDAILSH